MTRRYGRTSKNRFAATVSGMTAYAPDPNISLKATNHLTEPAAIGPVADAAPVAFGDSSWMTPCGEDSDERKYGQTRRRRRRRRGRRRSRRRRVASGATAVKGKCDDLYDSGKPFGGSAYQDCIIGSTR